jgi:hyperosmotically inducible periplasmic protein
MKIKTSLFMALAILALLSSCKPSDEKITEAVKLALSANAALSPVTPTVKDCVVTLNGEVEDDGIKSLAETTLAEVKGIKSIVNNVTVKPKGPSPEEIKASADSALQAQVNDAFTKYAVTGITATVADSVVTLTGDIKRKDLPNAMKAAMEAAPKKVENQMTIK